MDSVYVSPVSFVMFRYWLLGKLLVRLYLVLMQLSTITHVQVVIP